MKKVLTFGMKALFGIHNSPLIIGICVGIAISIVLTPFFQSKCIRLSSNHFSDGMRLSNIRDIRSNIHGDAEEDFEPSLNLNDASEIYKNGDSEKQPSKLIRPRYYSTELGMKDSILVSVISTKYSIGSFGISVNRTLNHYVDKLLFFLDGTGSKKLGLNIPIVGFKDSKPLIKIFRILSYIGENFMEDYNYYMFVTDHTYVDGKKLMAMLDQISVSQNLHMGALQIEKDSLYCDLDGGIILSQRILEAVVKELQWCTRHSFSDSMSDNFGRCVLHASNLPCKSTYQLETFKSFSVSDASQSIDTLIEKRESSLGEAMTISGLTQPTDMFHLHVNNLQNFIVRTKKEVLRLRDQIKTTVESSPLNSTSTWPGGSPNGQRPSTRYDLISWETFNSTHILMPNDFENIRALSGSDHVDIGNVIESSVAHIQERYPDLVQYGSLKYGHRRYDPTRGMDYLLSLTFIDTKGEVVMKRTEAHRGLTQPEILPMPYVTENKRVNLCLFIQKEQVESAKKFVHRIEQKVKVEAMTLNFYLIYDEGESYLAKDDPYKELKETLKKFAKTYYNTESRATFVHLTAPNGRPSDFALLDLAVKKFPSDSLLFLTDPDSTLNTDFLNRVRMNTIKDWQVFSPIPFSLYHPNLIEDTVSYGKMEINSKNGHFDEFNFGQLSFYVEDYVEARKLISEEIPVIRNEKDLRHDRKMSDTPVTVHGMFLGVTNLHVLRGVEPGLVRDYSPIDCSSSSSQSANAFCERRQSLSMGQKSYLSKLIYEYMQHGEKI